MASQIHRVLDWISETFQLRPAAQLSEIPEPERASIVIEATGGGWAFVEYSQIVSTILPAQPEAVLVSNLTAQRISRVIAMDFHIQVGGLAADSITSLEIRRSPAGTGVPKPVTVYADQRNLAAGLLFRQDWRALSPPTGIMVPPKCELVLFHQNTQGLTLEFAFLALHVPSGSPLPF